MPVHPNSIEALRKYQWQKGQSGNPEGRPPNFGESMRGWWNLLQEATQEELEAIASEPGTPTNAAAAAASMLTARSRDRNAAGTPISTAVLQLIIEQTAGKPSQPVDVTSKGEPLKGYVGIPVEEV